MPLIKPKLFTTLKDYNKDQFIADATAGVIVGIVALPLAIAFAIASGVTPEKGIITAIIAGFIISVFGGSRVQIGGPTGAFIIIVYGIVQNYGTTGLTIATIMAGIILVIMGLARFGSLIKFIPYPVVVGFTSGIALLIFSTQIKDFFGLQIPKIPAEFHEKWIAYFGAFSTINYSVFG
ncbi:MAG: SulP family inorganic anion transporter, partial [Ignavibacteriaceae bacterium]|nr:SulP family inorganic anion transporter [Ignavibacteriaceae bacterium]